MEDIQFYHLKNSAKCYWIYQVGITLALIKCYLCCLQLANAMIITMPFSFLPRMIRVGD